MPYVCMRINYFKTLDGFLTHDNYIKIYKKNGYIPVIDMIEKKENGQEVVKVSSWNGRYQNILDLCLDLSTKLNDGISPFPQYKNVKMRNKTLDMVILNDYQIYFYRLRNDKVLGTVTKTIDDERIIEVFSFIGKDLKNAFELLDSHIYNKFGFYPGEELEQYVKVKSRKVD